MADILEVVATCDVRMVENVLTCIPDSVNKRGWGGMTALHKASMRGDSAIVKLLLDSGADITARTDYDETPLLYACKRGNPAVIEMLIAHEASLDEVDRAGQTVCHHAAHGGSIYALCYLSAHNLSLAVRDANLRTPLHVAIQHGHLDTTEYLLKKEKSIVESSDVNGEIPLHMAASGGFLEIAWLLLSHSKDATSAITLENREGVTSIDLARQGKHPRHQTMARFLQKCKTQPRWISPLNAYLPYMCMLLYPNTAYVMLIIMANVLVPTRQWMVLLPGMALLAFNLTRQHHRLNHPSRWQNPLHKGLFIAAIMWTCTYYMLNIFPKLRGNLLLDWSCLALVGALCATSWVLLRREPGFVHTSRTKESADSPAMGIIDVARKLVPAGSFCGYCEIVMPDFCKHCRLCNSCVRGMDHHCLYLNKCIGHKNHRLFITFLCILVVAHTAFISLTAYYLHFTYPIESAASILDIVMNECAFLVSLVIINFCALLWELNFLHFEFSLLSRGYTIALRPMMYSLKDTTMSRKISNISQFLQGKRIYESNSSQTLNVV